METVPNNLLISFQFFKCKTGQIIEMKVLFEMIILTDKCPHCKYIFAVSGEDLYN